LRQLILILSELSYEFIGKEIKMKLKIKASLIIVFLFFISGCVKLPEDVVAPNWDTDFNIPITNKTYKLAEIIKPQKYIDIDSDSNYIFSSDVYTYSTGVAEYLDKSDETNSQDDDLIASNEERDVYVEFPGGIKLSSAKFREGLLTFHADNLSSSENVIINIRIPGLKDSSGKVLSGQLTLLPGDSGTLSTVLNDYYYQKPPSQPDSLDHGFLVKITASSNSNTAETHIDFTTSGFKFKSATGYFPSKTLELVENRTNLEFGNDISNFKGNIYLTGAVLKLKAQYLSSSINPFELELKNFQVNGYSLQDNKQVQLIFKNISELNSPTSSAISFKLGTVDTIFNESNSNINDFISFLPDEMVINTSPVMNPDDDKNYKTVTENDSVKIESFLTTKGIDLISNPQVTIKKSTLKDTLELDIDQSDRDALSDGKNADINIQVTNYIPLTSWIKITLADKDYKMLSSITTSNDGVDSLKFSGAKVNSTSGVVTSASQSTQTINLSSSQIQSLADAYYAIVSVSLETSSYNETNPVRVLLRASDWVEIRASGRVKYNLNPGK